MKKRTPFYTRGNNPTVTPKTAPQRAVLPQGAAVLPLGPAVLPPPLAVLSCSLGGLKKEHETGPVRNCRGGRAVLPLLGGTTAPTADAKCRTTRHERRPPRVDAVGARYRSGTTAEDPQAVLPLESDIAACGS